MPISELTDSTPEDRTSRHWRALALIAVSMLVVASASAIYLHPITATQMDTLPQVLAPPGDGVVLPDLANQPSGPSPSPRKMGLVRRGATGVLIEQFGGMNDQPALGLKASVQISDPAVVSKLVHDLNALPAFPDALMFCPLDDGSYFALELAYADGTSTGVKVEAAGCGGVYIGGSSHAAAWTATTPAFDESLKGLLAPDSVMRASI
jgi:hypothetical protein